MVLQFGFAKRSLLMASSAISPKSTVMCVIFRVAAITLFCQFYFLTDRPHVAGRAIDSSMGISQYKFCLFIVIKFPHFPVIGEMTQLTFASKFLLMIVIRFVAGITFYFGILEIAGVMAFFA